MALKDQYFKHDYNASEDDKIVIMTDEMGMEGYGIFYFLLERLAKAGGTLPKKMIRILAGKMKIGEDKLNKIITEYGLFVMEGEFFSSVRLREDIGERQLTLDLNSKGGKKSAEVRITKLKNTLEERRKKFGDDCSAYVPKYGKEMVRKFYEYWTETTKGGTKMRWETMKAFELSKRFARWKTNEENFNNNAVSTDGKAAVARNPGEGYNPA